MKFTFKMRLTPLLVWGGKAVKIGPQDPEGDF